MKTKDQFVSEYIQTQIAQGNNDYVAIAKNAIDSWNELEASNFDYEFENLKLEKAEKIIAEKKRVLAARFGRTLSNKHQASLANNQGSTVKVNRKERTDVKRVLSDGTKVIGNLRNEAHECHLVGDIDRFIGILYESHKNDSVPWSYEKCQKRGKHYFNLIAKGQY